MPRLVDKEAKKAEILQAAMKDFAKHGIVKTKMIDIATTAGIGKGTIYEYFRSKEEIFSEAYNTVFISMEEALAGVVNSTDDPVEKLNRLVELSLQHFITESRDFIGVMMDFWAEGIRKKDQKIINIIAMHEIYSKYRKLIASILTEGIEKGQFRNVDIHCMSATIIAALDGLLLQWIIDENLFDTKQLTRSFMDVFLNGIKK